MLHPASGVIIMSSPSFTSLAAKAGDTTIGFANLLFIAKNLVFQLKLKLASGQNSVDRDHDELGPAWLQVQGKVMVTGRYVIWVIHRCTFCQQNNHNLSAHLRDKIVSSEIQIRSIQQSEEEGLKTIQ